MQSAVHGRTPARIDRLRVVRDQAAASGEFNRTRPLAVQFVPDTADRSQMLPVPRELSCFGVQCSTVQRSAAQRSAARPRHSLQEDFCAVGHLLRLVEFLSIEVQLCSHQPAGRCMPHRIATCTSWQMHATSHCHMHQLADACHITFPHAVGSNAPSLSAAIYLPQPSFSMHACMRRARTDRPCLRW